MKENMPDISFERSMNHNYMILGKCSFFGNAGDESADYRTKMLLENHIPGLLPVTHRLINGESRYYYEINSLQSLDRLYDKTEIRYDGLRRLLSGCVSLFDRLEEYLLDGTQIIIRPELIYIDVERMEPYFVCYPGYEGDVRLSFMEFIDELLTRIDHTDERAVMLGYQIYRYTRNPNYVISEIGNMMEHTIVSLAQKEAEYVRKDPETVSRINMPDVIEKQNNFEAYFCEAYENDTETSGEATDPKSGKIGDLIGGVFCIFVSLCSGAVILGARMIHSFQLSGNSELYLYGATGMAIVAAVLFFSCYIKKRRQEEATELSDDGEICEDAGYYTSVDSAYDAGRSYDCQLQDFQEKADEPNVRANISHRLSDTPQNVPPAGQNVYNETMYLGDRVVEERRLCGRMNGKEVSISLDRLPMTVGKLANVSDFVINDAAVSKMHARFEERDGRVYICDLNSTNGTVRNGILLGVNQSVALEPGDRLRFGRTCFTYC